MDLDNLLSLDSPLSVDLNSLCNSVNLNSLPDDINISGPSDKMFHLNPSNAPLIPKSELIFRGDGQPRPIQLLPIPSIQPMQHTQQVSMIPVQYYIPQMSTTGTVSFRLPDVTASTATRMVSGLLSFRPVTAVPPSISLPSWFPPRARSFSTKPECPMIKLASRKTHHMFLRKRKSIVKTEEIPPPPPKKKIKKERIICAQNNCNRTAVYGVVGMESVWYCKKHAHSSYERKGKRCLKCDKYPSFASIGSTIAYFCKLHSKSYHINITVRRCISPNCTLPAYYGDLNVRSALYCIGHAPDGYANVTHKTCTHPGCKTIVQMGPVSQSKTVCTLHRTPNDYSKINPRCHIENCNKSAVYAIEGYYPKRCADHHFKTDLLLSMRTCASCKNPFIMPSNRVLCQICSK